MFIKCFPGNWTEDDIKAKVAGASNIKIADISSVFINKDDTGSSKWNGIVTFNNWNDTVKAITTLNGMRIDG